MVHETTKRDPERIYLEPWPYSPEGRLWSAENVWPLYTWPPEPEGESERATGVEYIRSDLHAVEVARLTRELEEARRERSAAKAEVLTAQASLRRVERVLEEARERERALRDAVEKLITLGRLHYAHYGHDYECQACAEWERAEAEVRLVLDANQDMESTL